MLVSTQIYLYENKLLNISLLQTTKTGEIPRTLINKLKKNYFSYYYDFLCWWSDWWISGFHYGIELCRFLLRLLGGWPDPYIEKKWWSSIHPLMVASTMIFFTTISQIVQMIRYLGDMNYVIEVSVNCCIPVSIAMVKLVSVWYHRDGNVLSKQRQFRISIVTIF